MKLVDQQKGSKIADKIEVMEKNTFREQNRHLKGRQILFVIVNSFVASKRFKSAWSLDDLAKCEWKGDSYHNVHDFRTLWLEMKREILEGKDWVDEMIGDKDEVRERYKERYQKLMEKKSRSLGSNFNFNSNEESPAPRKEKGCSIIYMYNCVSLK